MGAAVSETRWPRNRDEQVIALLERHDDVAHYTRRMLQALDGYWMWCDGWQGSANRWPRSESTAEDWWIRFEKYRAKVEELL